MVVNQAQRWLRHGKRVPDTSVTRTVKLSEKTRSKKKETVRLPFFLCFFFFFHQHLKLDGFKKGVMSLITDLSEIKQPLYSSDRKRRIDSSLLITKKIITMNKNAWQM